MTGGQTSKGSDDTSRPVLGLMALFAGLMSSIPIYWFGELYASELILPLIALSLILLYGDKKIFSSWLVKGLLVAGFMTILGYVITDVSLGTKLEQLLKGWARIIFVLINAIALIIIAAHHRNSIWWFVIGIAIGGICYLYVQGVPWTIWKLGYGENISLLIIASTVLLPFRIAIVVLLALGLIHIGLDYRNLGAACLVVAAIVWSRVGSPEKVVNDFAHMSKLILLGMLTLFILVTALIVTQDEYADRRSESNAGRTAGILVSIDAIMDSPFIGYGSWTENTELARKLKKEVDRRTPAQNRKFASHGKNFRSHSQFLQSWVEAGILGVAFFLFYACILIWGFYRLAFTRALDRFTALYLYVVIVSLWHLLASPFGGEMRVHITLAIATLFMLTYEKTWRQDRGRETCVNGNKESNRIAGFHVLQRKNF
jgi:O-antigen ligase